MAKDPAFLFYPGSAAEDVQVMSRLERGAYFDLLRAQKKFEKFTLDQIKKFLGPDFEACWPALEMVLEHEDEFYFIGWVREAIETRKQFSEKQKKKIQDYWNKKNDSKPIPEVNHGNSKSIPELNHGNSVELPLINTNRNRNRNAIESEMQLKVGVQGELVSRGTETQKMINDLCEYFSIKPILSSPIYDSIDQFVTTVANRSQFQALATAFEKYKSYKSSSKEARHNISTWMGTAAAHFQDGQWCLIDWEAKCTSFEKTISHRPAAKKGTYNGITHFPTTFGALIGAISCLVDVPLP